jgi:hypothetical protein
MTDEVNSKYKRISEYNQKQTDFDTIFEYTLKNDEALRIAQDGLFDLINTAPITMATQNKKIRSIEIIDNINKKKMYTQLNVQKNLIIYI